MIYSTVNRACFELKNYSFEDSAAGRRRLSWLHEGARKHWLKSLFLKAMVLLVSAPASAQFIGYTTSQSTIQTVFNNVTGSPPAVSSVITNLGASAHFFTICNTTFSGTVVIQSSKDGSFNPPNTVAAANYAISSGAQPAPTTDSNCHLIQAGGYYPTLRVTVTAFGGGTGGRVSVFYSGIGAPIAFAPAALSSSGPTSPIACDQHTSALIGPTVALATLISGLPGQTIIVCSITMSFDSNTASGGLIVFGTDATASGSPASCTALAPFISQIHTFTDTTNPIHLLGGAGGLWRAPPSLPVCINTASVGADTQVELSFAQITF